MFSFGGTSSPARSESVASSTWDGSSLATCSPSRDSNWTSNNGSPTSSVSSFRTNSSIVSNGVKSRQIRDLKLEMELKDSRINELESAYEELERRAAFQQGETQCKLENYEHEMGAMSDEQTKLKETIAEQNSKLDEVNKTLADFQSMHSSFKMMMERCAELEAFQRRKQQEEEEAKKKAEEEAAQKKKEEEEAAAAAQKKAEEEEAERKRKAQEAEAEASRLAQEEEARYLAEEQRRKEEEELLARQQQQQRSAAQQRPQSAPQNNRRNSRVNGKTKDCSVM